MANQLLRDAIWTSQRLSRCDLQAHLAFTYLLPIADHWGLWEYDLRSIWAKVAAYRGDITEKILQKWLDTLERNGLFIRYQSDGKDFAAWMNFKGMPKSQRTPSRFPMPPFDNSGGGPTAGHTSTPTTDVPIGVVKEKEYEKEEEDENKGPTAPALTQTDQLLRRFNTVFNAIYKRRAAPPALTGPARNRMAELRKAYGDDGFCCLPLVAYAHDRAASEQRPKDRAVSHLFHDGSRNTFNWGTLMETADTLASRIPEQGVERIWEVAREHSLETALGKLGFQRVSAPDPDPFAAVVAPRHNPKPGETLKKLREMQCRVTDD
jgi:hypothetical protein